ncbi:hypothetical protein UPYG_G00279570 [Umbra pygmaea]|uniref:Drebrin-like protein n=1 Tax=Umbra pygmaea TaxID=75934 RepID=A0ABD0WRP8_UMBPY
MSVNLSKNGAALKAAYEDVVDVKSDTNWALFTYEGNSNDIRLAGKGDGGLEEMVEELNSGKVMYAFCRVKEPNSGLSKYILINWTGDGVKDSRKGQCANHVISMGNFLRGAHVTINARGEDDVDPKSIMNDVAKASGGNFNLSKQTKKYRDVPSGPVGSVYQKTSAVDEILQTKDTQNYKEIPRQPVGSVYQKINAVDEILQTDKDNFWAKSQKDEEKRRKEESKRAEEERQSEERERKQQDEKEAAERKIRAKEVAAQIDRDKTYQKQQETKDNDQVKQHATQQESEVQSGMWKRPASVQKANEAASLVSQRSINPRELFKQREQSASLDNGLTQLSSRPGKLQSPFLSQMSTVKEIETHSAQTRSSLFPGTQDPLLTKAPALLLPKSVEPTASNLALQPTEEEYWSDEFDDDTEEQTDPTSGPQSPRVANEVMYEYICHKNPTHMTNVAQVMEHEPEGSGQNLSARALYDYQAMDDTEITFDPDDIITDIDMVDEGWWRGYGPNGHYGMFPANYVELL